MLVARSLVICRWKFQFLLQRGAVIKATLSSPNYRKSPPVQGGLEIPRRVSVSMPVTLKNRQKNLEYCLLPPILTEKTRKRQ